MEKKPRLFCWKEATWREAVGDERTRCEHVPAEPSPQMTHQLTVARQVSLKGTNRTAQPAQRIARNKKSGCFKPRSLVAAGSGEHYYTTIRKCNTLSMGR